MIGEAAPLEALRAEIGALPGIVGTRIEYGELIADAERDALIPLMTTLREDARFAFEQVMDICGVDWPERDERFDVVYNLLSVSRNQRLRVIVRTDEKRPVPSLHKLWPCATWWEREAWDMYGILFSGQPDLRRILTDYGFDGHPLRKDFPLTGYVEVRYDEDQKSVVYDPVKLTQDWRSFDFLSPWEGITTLPGDEKVHAARQAEGPRESTTPAAPKG
ncbi:MAG: NADH-quinone oxidoreductase subunit C [Acetobacteraceae bacterium]|nr:NADH-quinone oxidoreductase subunit C [Acetobacteraceae bacterium]